MKLIFTLLFVFTLIGLKAQVQKSPIKSVEAFYKAYLPGQQKVDENGIPIKSLVTIERFLYVEYKKGTNLQVEEVTYNNNKIKVVETVLIGQKAKVGTKINSDLQTELTAKKGYTYWLITLDSKQKDEKDMGKSLKIINIKAKVGTKYFNFSIKEETELLAPEMQ